ncbi:hypothetical protein TKK_0001165 [Trichogramma kaykai]
MLVRLPTEKIEKVKRITNIKQKTVKIRDFARILGFLVSCCPAVKYGYCYTKNCEREKFLALRFNDSDYNKSMTLPASINEDLRWWNTVNLHKGNPIKNAVYELEIYSDASLTGWGAVCNGEKAHGHWSTLERELHINQLELIAAFFGLRAFAKDSNMQPFGRELPWWSRSCPENTGTKRCTKRGSGDICVVHHRFIVQAM